MNRRTGMRRGQAAIEFIMTYGWAILVVLVMIGAITYFGVVNVKKTLPERCLLSAGLDCKDFKVSYNGKNMQLLLKIENKQGKTITIDSGNVTFVYGTSYYNNTCMTTNAIDPDGTGTITCTFGPGSSPDVGQPVKLGLSLTYSTIPGSFSHTATGEIQTKVQS